MFLLIRQMHYPPETATIMLIAKIFAMIHQAQNKEGILHLLNQVIFLIFNFTYKFRISKFFF